MGWRQRFDPAQLRERAKRLGDIRALGQRVDRVRRGGLRGEFLVPLVAALILIAALSFAALSPGNDAAPTPPSVAEAPSATLLVPNGTPLPSDSGYPAFDLTPSPGLDGTALPTPDFGLTTTPPITDGSVLENPSESGYPSVAEGPEGLDPVTDDIPTPDFGSVPSPVQQPPQSQPIPTPDLIGQPSTGTNGAYPAPPPTPRRSQSAPVPTVSPGVDNDEPVPTPDLGSDPDSDPTEAQTPSTIEDVTPTPEITITPEPTLPPPTPTARPARVLSGNLRWTAAQSPIAISEDQAIAAGSTLTIDPGVEVQFGPDVRLTVAGTLRAQGTADAPVRLVGSGGVWNGLVGTVGSTIILDNAQVRQAGTEGTAISSTGGALVVRNTSLSDNRGGIVGLGSAVEIRGSQITGNAIPGNAVNIQLPQRGATLITGSTIGNNGTPSGAAQLLLTGNEAAGPITLENNLILGGSGPGVQVNTNAALGGTIRCNSFQGGTIGLQLAARRPDTTGFNLQIDTNSFTGQVTYGATGSLAFNLANNWWADPSGPFDPQRNAQGRGVPIGVNLQFQPWLQSRPGCAPGQ